MPTTGRTTITPNGFLHRPVRRPRDQIPAIVFYITGNPGLIGYYHEFLNLLLLPPPPPPCDPERQAAPHASTLKSPGDGNEAPSTTTSVVAQCVVAGFSLGGFDLPADVSLPSATANGSRIRSVSGDGDGHKVTTTTTTTADQGEDLDGLLYPPGYERKEIYSLRDQVELCYARLTALVARVAEEYGPPIPGDDGHVKVILMGHSVGAYIALEMVRTHHERSSGSYVRPVGSTATATTTATVEVSSPSTLAPSDLGWPSTDSAVPMSFTITDAILLTPTILDLACSPSGRLATPVLSNLPFFPSLAQLLSTGLASVLSEARLNWLVSKITGMDPGGDALAVTLELVRNPGLIRQGLCLARDEMREIGPMNWGEEVWGAISGESPQDKEDGGKDVNMDMDKDGVRRAADESWTVPNLYFWFASEDHWVASTTRDKIVDMVKDRSGHEEKATRVKRAQQKLHVVVDEDEGLVHAWSIAQSKLVAKRVYSWLGEALRAHS